MMLKPRLLFISAILLIVTAVVACLKPESDTFATGKEAVVMRSIGHQILLSSGDSTSRVLPVSKINDHEYQIQFERALIFKTDSVMKIIRQAITANHLPPDYVVNFVDSLSNQVVYGFAVLKTEQNQVMPCKGRTQPRANYLVHITFRKNSTGMLNKNYIVGAGSGLAALILIFSGLGLNRGEHKPSANLVSPALPTVTPVIYIGRYWFNPAHPYLELKEEKIKLSDKEFKLLSILARHLNTVVDRSDLQKVWEDDGVIVGRSLDMFISKLRKKLDQDPSVRLINVHGKGYKLETT
ncbi:winged helix-turn-helix domain-containing protein [Mucilaginibacter sp. CSA2-8R]|uniref:winged helix-turn-helix domain-containing protein n=1 Tax=Mucilaginibacter sp. CSA2-8R TaxID=3141542 RepID=UPI00315DE005